MRGNDVADGNLAPVSILIVDDHAIWREAVRSMLLASEFCVVGEAATGTEALAVAARVRPQVTLLDIRLPDGSGLDLLPRLLELAPRMCIVIQTMYDLPVFAESAIARGAAGYVVKGSGQAELLAVLREACA